MFNLDKPQLKTIMYITLGVILGWIVCKHYSRENMAADNLDIDSIFKSYLSEKNINVPTKLDTYKITETVFIDLVQQLKNTTGMTNEDLGFRDNTPTDIYNDLKKEFKNKILTWKDIKLSL